jgi:hypothetical protein
MEFLEAPLYDDDLAKLAFRFVHNLLFMALVVRFGLNRNSRDREFAFTAVMLNITVFFICFTLKKLDNLSLGMAIGLFAIFGVLRYRTDTIRTKEMTYLFIVIGIAVVNSLTNRQTSYLELLAVNSTIFAAVMIKEGILRRAGPSKSKPARKKSVKHTLVYDNLELIAPDRREQLKEDLRRRTGIDATRLQVDSIDLSTSTATITVWCPDPPPRKV